MAAYDTKPLAQLEIDKLRRELMAKIKEEIRRELRKQDRSRQIINHRVDHMAVTSVAVRDSPSATSVLVLATSSDTAGRSKAVGLTQL